MGRGRGVKSLSLSIGASVLLLIPVSIRSFHHHSSLLSQLGKNNLQDNGKNALFAALEPQRQDEQQQQQKQDNNTIIELNNSIKKEEISNQESLLLSLGLIDEVESEEDKQRRIIERRRAKEAKEKEKLSNAIVAILSALI